MASTQAQLSSSGRPITRRLAAPARRRQILDVAAGLFAKQGFTATTTRQIAERAGVTEAIIFRHFPRKEDLYWAVLEMKCGVASGHARLDEKMASAEDDRELFAGVAEDMLRRNAADTSLTRLLLFSALEDHELSHRIFRTFIAERYELLAKRIRARVAEGAFRETDALLAARGFIGMIVYHFLVQELFGGKRDRHFEPREVALALTDIWLDGMRARRNGKRTNAGNEKS